MIHRSLDIACSILILLSLPGTIELAMITFAGVFRLRDRTPKATAAKICSLAIVVPAHDEAATIVRCVSSIAACTQPDSLNTQIVVIADNCTDATADLARGGRARVLERFDTAHRGKGFALKFAFQILLSEGFDAVMVVDAD